MSDDEVLERLPRGPHGLTRERVEASQRARMLRSMIRSVAAKGYAKTVVADVIGGAGVSRAAFYEQFSDIEDCFLAAYEASVQTLLARITEAGDAGEPLPAAFAPGADRFVALLDRYLAGIRADPLAARVFLIEVYGAGPVALERRYAVLRRFVDLVDDVIGRAPGWPRDPRGHRLRSEALVGAISSMVATRLAADAVDALGEIREPVLRLAGLSGPRLTGTAASEEH